MSERNVEIVRGLYADPDGLTGASAEIVAPDAEFDFSAVYPDQPVMRGIEEMRRFRESGPWGGSPIHFIPERFIDVDDERVLVLLRVSATGSGSGAPVDLAVAHVITLREGRLVRFEVYRDRDEAFAAAGLSA
jgi:ketosteroid isomerase-like protein